MGLMVVPHKLLLPCDLNTSRLFGFITQNAYGYCIASAATAVAAAISVIGCLSCRQLLLIIIPSTITVISSP